jgi:hypothetical protein
VFNQEKLTDKKGLFPEAQIVSVTVFNLFSEINNCCSPLNIEMHINESTRPTKKWLRLGNYQLKMYHPGYVDNSIAELSHSADTFQLEHIPAYSTLINISKVNIEAL